MYFMKGIDFTINARFNRVKLQPQLKESGLISRAAEKLLGVDLLGPVESSFQLIDSELIESM